MDISQSGMFEFIKFECPSCGKHMTTEAKNIGKSARCLKCRMPLNVPGGEPPKQARPIRRKQQKNQLENGVVYPFFVGCLFVGSLLNVGIVVSIFLGWSSLWWLWVPIVTYGIGAALTSETNCSQGRTSKPKPNAAKAIASPTKPEKPKAAKAVASPTEPEKPKAAKAIASPTEPAKAVAAPDQFAQGADETEVQDVLRQLGYRPAEAKRVFREASIRHPDLGSEALVQAILQRRGVLIR